MDESPEPCQRRPHPEPDRHSIEFARAAKSAGLLESAMWPYLPLCAARAISMALLLVMAVGVFATFSRGAHAQSTEVLISNGEPPPSAFRSAGGALDFSCRRALLCSDTGGVDEGGRAMTLDDAALVVIDVQNDFCPGGALEVPDGDGVVPVINRIAPRFPACIVAQDWHPPGHLSFASSHEGKSPFETTTLPYGEQVLWPDHCVQDTHGAAFHQDLATRGADLVLRKGFRPSIDSYSAFYENDRTTSTGLAGYLRSRGISRLFFAGLATDFCVAFSAIDGAREGFECTVIEDACRGIDLDGSLGAAWEQMAEAKVARVESHKI